jgi:hypothetical protein
VDRAGKLAHPATWDRATGFAAGLAWVQRGDEKHCLAPDGTLLPRGAWPLAPADPGAPVPTQDGTRWGFRRSSGEPVGAATFERAHPFHGGRARVRAQGRWGFVDASGAVVIPASYLKARDFSDGLAAVWIGSLVEGAWGYVNDRGAVVIAPELDRAGPHRHGFAAAEVGPGFAYVDGQGRRFNGPHLDAGSGPCRLAPPLQAVPSPSPRLVDPFGQLLVFHRDGRGHDAVDGRARVEEGGRGGWVDAQGAWIARGQYREVRDFHEGLALASDSNTWGYVRSDGTLAIPARFRHAGDFTEGLAWVALTLDEAAKEGGPR